IYARGGHDVVRGGPGRDRIYGGGQRDILVGGPGRDVLVGGAGPDLILARDQTRDVVRGGSGRDVAMMDGFDRRRSVESGIPSARSRWASKPLI
ncbi:MAG: hypothetical protein ACR2L0_00395, partial [Gaiellaceae bacterium]